MGVASVQRARRHKPPRAIVPTTDGERSKDFYGDVLGLFLVDDDGFALFSSLPAAQRCG